MTEFQERETLQIFNVRFEGTNSEYNEIIGRVLASDTHRDWSALEYQIRGHFDAFSPQAVEQCRRLADLDHALHKMAARVVHEVTRHDRT